MRMPLLSLVLVAASLFAGPALAGPSPWGPERAPIGWVASRADWKLVIRDGEPVRVEGTYVLTSVDPAAESPTLVGPELLITEVSGPVFAGPSGLRVALGPEKRRVEQKFAGLYEASSDGNLTLLVLKATRTHVTVDAPGLDVTIDGAVDGWLAPSSTLNVSWRPHVEGEMAYEQLVTQGETAATFRGDAGGLLVDAVVRWRVVRGEAKRLTFAANGLEELEIAGEGVAKWRREGDSVIVEPKAPVKGLFVVTVKGRATLGKGQRSVPLPEPTNVLRFDRYVTMARSDEGEIIPVSMPSSVPLAGLPAWAKNIGDGIPLVAWHGPQPVSVLAGAFETVQGPDTVITQARYTLAAAREGHAALRMNLRVRNERRQYLHLRPGKGWTPIVIRVGNQPVSWLSDGEGGIYVPLEKSVETVKGLLSFPVDVEWLGSDTPVWGKKGEMELTLPSVDAPVQAATWEVHLPRGYRALRTADSGTGHMLLGDLRERPVEDESSYASAEREKQEVVSSALQNAVTAYKQNDWSTAQEWLDQAKTADSGNEDAQSLQANLDVIEGRTASNDLGSRRVRDLAKAKTSGLQEKQSSVEHEAEYALRSGDLDAAEAKYSAALELADTLQKTEQLESAEQSSKVQSARSKLAEIQTQRKQQADRLPSNVFDSNSDLGSSAFGNGDALEQDYDGIADTIDYAEPEEIAEEGESPYAGGADVSGMFEVLGGEANVEGAVEGTGFGGLGMSGTGEGGGGSSDGDIGLGTIGTLGQGAGRGYGSAYGAGATVSHGAAAPTPPAGDASKGAAVTIATEQQAAYGNGRDENTWMEEDEEVVTTKSTESTREYDRRAVVASEKKPLIQLPGLGGKKKAKEEPEKSRAAGPMAAPTLATPTVPMPAPKTATASGRAYASPVAKPDAAPQAALAAMGYLDAAPPEAPAPVLAPTPRPPPMPTQAAPRPSPSSRMTLSGKMGAKDTKEEAKKEESTVSDKSVRYKADTTIDFEGLDVLDAPPPPPPPPPGAYTRDDDSGGEAYAADPYGYDQPTSGAELDWGVNGAAAGTPMEPPADPAYRGVDDGKNTFHGDPKLAVRPRPAPEKRAALVASPSPMALAMPLDGPTLTTTQALQPANTFPTFKFLYKSLPSENL